MHEQPLYTLRHCKCSKLCTVCVYVQVADSKHSLEKGSSCSSQSIQIQHPIAAADICRPLVDSVMVWEGIAAAEYAFDGVLDGWDSDSEMPRESVEDKYLQVPFALHQSVKFSCHSIQACSWQNNALCCPFGHDIVFSSQHDVYSCTQ